MENMNLIMSVLEQGLIYGLMALGVYITYKILDFPDMTTDGSFPLGASLTATLLTKGINPFFTLIIAFAAGALAGVCTGLIHVKLKVRDLLSGIIMFTGLYTVNLRIAGGKANVPLFNQQTIFNNDVFQALIPESLSRYQVVLVALVLAVFVKVILDLYLKTKSGFLLRAAGDNPAIVTSLAKDIGLVKIVGLALGNGLVALGGCVFAQQQRFFDMTMGTGTVVIGLASVIIGTGLFKNMYFVKPTTAVLIGSILYKACVAVAISCGLAATDMKLVTAVAFLIILVISMDRKRKVKSNA